MALGVGGAFALLVAYFVVFGSGNRGGPAKPPVAGDPLAVPLGIGAADQQILPFGRTRIDLTDKVDLNKRIGVFSFDRMDPLAGNRFNVKEPALWRYLDDGRYLHIRADSGEVYRPGGQDAPESGTISGNVQIKLFEPGIDINTIDPASAPSLMTVSTESLSFEAAVGKLNTEDAFRVAWEGGTFEGEGLILVFNQPLAQLQGGEVHRKGKLTLTGTEKTRSPGPAAPQASSDPAVRVAGGAESTPPKPATPAKPVIETMYRLVGSGNVVASQAGRQLHSDAFAVFARLLDNRLPENAIRDVRFVKESAAPAAPTPSARPDGSGVAAVTRAEGEQPDLATKKPGSAEPFIMTWDGPCVIVPLKEAPAELSKDHLAARFNAEAGRRVMLAASENGISGAASSIDYSATRGLLLLSGAGATGVELGSVQAGRIETGRLEADLATGMVRTPGPGTLRSARESSAKPEDEQRLTWRDHGEFSFHTTEQGLTGRLKAAALSGDVKGEGKGLSFESAEARAEFASLPTGKLEVSTVDLAGRAQARSTDTGRLAGERLHVEFDPPVGTGNPRARFVRAEDGFEVERDGQFLSGRFLESRLIDVANGKVDVGSVLARGGVKFRSEKDFISGNTEDLTADLGFDESGRRRQSILLVGEGTTLTRNDPGKEQGTISGRQLAIDGIKARIEGFGDGTFAYKGLNGGEESTIDASWKRRMVYDDTAGQIDCWGDAAVRYSPDPNTKNKVDADRVKLVITPAVPGRSVLSSGSAPRDAAARERAVLSAEAIGSIQDREGGVNARIESRSYSAGALQKLSYVEGPAIFADNQKGTIDVPGAGKFLVLDQSEGEKATSAAPGARDLGGDTRGSSLFEWATSLHAEKLAGGETTLTMKDDVSVVHRALADGAVTEIKCEDIIARLADRAGSLAESGRGLELRSVLAKGSVYAASGPPKTSEQPRPPLRELIAHTMEYDAVARRIEAKALPGGVVTMFEPAAASPTTAAWLTWDMTKNVIQVKQPAGAAPR